MNADLIQSDFLSLVPSMLAPQVDVEVLNCLVSQAMGSKLAHLSSSVREAVTALLFKGEWTAISNHCSNEAFDTHVNDLVDLLLPPIPVIKTAAAPPVLVSLSADSALPPAKKLPPTDQERQLGLMLKSSRDEIRELRAAFKVVSSQKTQLRTLLSKTAPLPPIAGNLQNTSSSATSIATVVHRSEDANKNNSNSTRIPLQISQSPTIRTLAPLKESLLLAGPLMIPESSHVLTEDDVTFAIHAFQLSNRKHKTPLPSKRYKKADRVAKKQSFK